jgi:hypothetical protein
VLSAHLHPEFGWVCPSRGLRRVLGVALALAAVGLIAAANNLLAVIDDSRNDDRLAPASAPVTAEMPPPTPREVDLGRSGAVRSASPQVAVTNADAAKDNCVTATALAAGLVEAKVETSTGAACAANTWAYLDGTCVAGQVRKVRRVRMPIARSDVPAAAAAGVPPGQPGGKTEQAAATSPPPSPTVSAGAAPSRARRHAGGDAAAWRGGCTILLAVAGAARSAVACSEVSSASSDELTLAQASVQPL